MKYKFGKYERSQIIKNFKVEPDNNKITVNYLSDDSYILPYTFDNKVKIEADVEKQAIERSKYHPSPNVSLSEYLHNENTKYAFLAVLDIFNSIMLQTSRNLKGNTPGEVIANVLTGSMALFFVYNIYTIKHNFDQIKDIEKYDTYFEIKNVLFDECQLGNPNITEKERELTTNNIDDYTLDEVKCLKRKLDRSNSFLGYDHN